MTEDSNVILFPATPRGRRNAPAFHRWPVNVRHDIALHEFIHALEDAGFSVYVSEKGGNVFIQRNAGPEAA